MLNVKQGLDVIQTLDIASADQYSDPLPQGNYQGIMLYIYGTHSGSVDPSDAMGSVKVQLKGFGDICDITLVNLQKINNFMGGKPDSASGTAFHASAIIPFAYFGRQNAVMIRPGDVMKVWVQKAQTTITTMKCEISGIYGNAPENYIPVISQDRYNSLGGIQSEHISVPNLMGIMMLPASTTNPDMITVASSTFVSQFSFDSAMYYSDLLFNVESASVGAILIPFMTTSLADAVNDVVRVKFTGGSGYLDHVVISAVFDNVRRQISHNLVNAYRQTKFQDLSQQGLRRSGDKDTTKIHAPVGDGVGFDEDQLISG